MKNSNSYNDYHDFKSSVVHDVGEEVQGFYLHTSKAAAADHYENNGMVLCLCLLMLISAVITVVMTH